MVVWWPPNESEKYLVFLHMLLEGTPCLTVTPAKKAAGGLSSNAGISGFVFLSLSVLRKCLAR